MDNLSAITEFLESLKVWHYLTFFLVLAFIFGKKKEWEYEAKLFSDDSKDIQGEIEIEKFQKEPPQGELELNNAELLKNAEFEILLNENLISKFQIDEQGKNVTTIHPFLPTDKPNRTSRRLNNERKWGKCHFSVDPQIKPENNDSLVVKINGTAALSGKLLRD